MYEHNDTNKNRDIFTFFALLVSIFQFCVSMDEMSMSVNNTKSDYHASFVVCWITKHEIHGSISL